MIVNNAPSQSSLLALLKGVQEQSAKTAQNAKSDAPGALIDAVAKGDPDRAAALADEQAKLKEVLAKLQTNAADRREERKAAAQEKIARIKAQIEALRSAAGGDPKVVAKMAARLSRDLAAAAKEYAAAGGGGTAGAGASAATPPPAANSNTQATAAAAPAPGDASQDALSQNDVTHGDATQDAVADHDVTDGGNAQASAPDAANPSTNNASTPNDAGATTGAASDERAQDQDFVRKVRQLMSELKSIIEHQKHRMEIRGDGTRNGDIADADTALKDTGDSLGQIAGGTAPAALGVNITI